MQKRLEKLGMSAEREDDVECCYSRQTKFRLLDPDKNLWEIYALTGEIVHRGSLSASDAVAARDQSGGEAIWEHRLGDTRVSVAPCGRIHRRGAAFNVDLPEEQRRQLLAELLRILTPGGRVMSHGLVTDNVLPGGFLRLAGPAGF